MDVYLKKSVVQNIIITLEMPEKGGILGGETQRIISRYFYDEFGSSHSKPNEYIPHTPSLKKCIMEWKNEHIEFVGFIHSHPSGHNTLSRADIDYAIQFCNLNHEPYVLMFIFADQTIHGYQIFNDCSIVKSNIIISV